MGQSLFICSPPPPSLPPSSPPTAVFQRACSSLATNILPHLRSCRTFAVAVSAEDMSSLKSWVMEHKLSSIGALWASGVGASFAYTGRKSPIKTSLRLIHARMHAQALTLAVLSSAALLHYYESKHDDVENVGRNTVA